MLFNRLLILVGHQHCRIKNTITIKYWIFINVCICSVFYTLKFEYTIHVLNTFGNINQYAHSQINVMVSI